MSATDRARGTCVDVMSLRGGMASANQMGVIERWGSNLV